MRGKTIYELGIDQWGVDLIYRVMFTGNGLRHEFYSGPNSAKAEAAITSAVSLLQGEWLGATRPNPSLVALIGAITAQPALIGSEARNAAAASDLLARMMGEAGAGAVALLERVAAGMHTHAPLLRAQAAAGLQGLGMTAQEIKALPPSGSAPTSGATGHLHFATSSRLGYARFRSGVLLTPNSL